ncbi:NUDIX domain-containing protein [Paenibacillus sp. FSL R5-0407]|uniref:NUDIX domain-containing protein n=1 Tax=Paenibacillus sp. FSL R5-0407 TaxID=2975320 RepID=UPI0030F89C85
MELLSEISDKDFGFESSSSNVKYCVRRASRAVVINRNNQIAILFVSKHNYHKLPGGGIEEGEEMANALIREVVEEVGAEIDIVSEVGTIIEYRDKFELIQLSYCYLAKVKTLLDHQFLTDDEKANGFVLKWVSLEEAIALVQADKPFDYMGNFIRKRDYTFLAKAEKILKDFEG